MVKAALRRFFGKFKGGKKEDLRSERTKATQKAAGDTDISHMITPGVAPKEKIEPKTVERKPATAPVIPDVDVPSEAVQKGLALAAAEKKRQEEKKKKTILAGTKK